jgi:hypothetical protein
VFRDHGLPRKVISDRGRQFVSKFMKEFYHLVGIKANPSTAYHPQTNGQTERMNQEIEQYLRLFVNEKQTDWAEWIPLAEFTYNDKVNSATGHSPFFLEYGQHPWKGIEPRGESRNKSAVEFAEQMTRIRKDAVNSLNRAAKTMKRYYDRKRGESMTYNVGDLVWLDSANLPTSWPSKKLGDKRLGPFPIAKIYDNGHYKLGLPSSWRVHPVFNECVLHPYSPPKFDSQEKELPPPPQLVDGRLEYKVEAVLDSRLHHGKLEYLVKWEGYPNEENTWEPESHLKNAIPFIERFHAEHPSAPRRLRVPLCFVSIPPSLTDVGGIQTSWWNGKIVGKDSKCSHVDMTLKAG